MVSWYVVTHSVRADRPAPTVAVRQSASATAPGTTAPIVSANSRDALAGLCDQLEQYPSLSIGLTVIELDTGRRTDCQGDQPMTAASTTKLLMAALFLTKVEQGEFRLDQPLGPLSAQDQLQQLINQSNNDSWDAFLTQLGQPALTSYAQSLGLTSYHADLNEWSPNDMAALLTQLATGQILTAANRQLLLGFMSTTNDETLIPAALGDDVAVEHKYGRYLGTVNDGAIIGADNDHPYILVLFTNNEAGIEGDGATAIHDLTNFVDQQFRAR